MFKSLEYGMWIVDAPKGENAIDDAVNGEAFTFSMKVEFTR